MAETQVAVVTGGAHGLGRALCRQLAETGFDVVLADRDGDTATETAASITRDHAVRALPVQTDVTSPASVEALAATTVAEFGRLDLVVNNAGVWAMGAAWETELDEWRRVVDVNLFGVVHGIRAFVPILLQNPEGGHVINVASTAGITSGAYRAAYTASKHAVVGLSKSLRAEFTARKTSLKVSVVCPGKVETGIFDSAERLAQERAAALPEDVRRSFEAILGAESITSADAARYIMERVAAGEFWIFPGAAPAAKALEKECQRLLDAVRRA